MTDCSQLCDRMPLVALGRDRWTAEEEAHLQRCGDCQVEWKLLTQAAALGRDRPIAVDAGRVAAEAARRAREQRQADRLWRRSWAFTGLAAAAALMVVLWGSQKQTAPLVAVTPMREPTAPTPAPGPPGPSPVATAPTAGGSGKLELSLPELDQLQEGELDSLLDQADAPLTASSTRDGPSLGDPSDVELDHVLSTLEG